MVSKEYTLLEAGYLKLVKVLPELSERGNMIKTGSPKEMACLIDRTGTLFHYYRGTVTLGARRLREIIQTESLLEKRAKIKLIRKDDGKGRIEIKI